MNRQLQFTSEAEADVSSAYSYYEDCLKGLGSDFILCLEESLERMSRNPEMYPIAYKGLRRALIKRYPFGVFYLVESEAVVVIAVMHCSRNPDSWKKRI